MARQNGTNAKLSPQLKLKLNLKVCWAELGNIPSKFQVCKSIRCFKKVSMMFKFQVVRCFKKVSMMFQVF